MSRLKISNGLSGDSSPPSYWREAAGAEVDVADQQSLEKWAQVLDLSLPELHQAVRQFGPVIKDIRRGLLNQNDEAA
jgi:hypothetical protein